LKKKQKLRFICVRDEAALPLENQKFFGSFFQKRTASFALCGPIVHPRARMSLRHQSNIPVSPHAGTSQNSVRRGGKPLK
jgi:hypothetical protein